MYQVDVDARVPMLKITIGSTLTSDGLEQLIAESTNAREPFTQGYKLWIVLPILTRQPTPEEAFQLDLTVFFSKSAGLRQVAIQAPADEPTTARLVDTLVNLYREMNISVDVTRDEAQSRTALSL
jgi:hypothetical protein